MARYYPLIASSMLLFLAIIIGGQVAEMEAKYIFALNLVAGVGLLIGWYVRSAYPPRVKITKLRRVL